MREIKFRLIKNGEIVGYEKWYSGAKHSPDSGMVGYAAKPCWLYSKDNKSWTGTYIFHHSKEQFTGIRDKCGKNGYESDFVSFGTTRPLYVIRWSVSNAEFYLESKDERKDYLHISNMVVGKIEGNIHDEETRDAKP